MKAFQWQYLIKFINNVLIKHLPITRHHNEPQYHQILPFLPIGAPCSRQWCTFCHYHWKSALNSFHAFILFNKKEHLYLFWLFNGQKRTSLENITSYLYVHHTCFKHMAYVFKKHEPMKLKFCANFEWTVETSRFVI